MLAAPASQHPWTIVISARLVGPSTATWSPGSMPRACRAAPTARASSCSWPQETCGSASTGATDGPTKRTPPRRSAAICRRSVIGMGPGIDRTVVAAGPDGQARSVARPSPPFRGRGLHRRRPDGGPVRRSDAIRSDRADARRRRRVEVDHQLVDGHRWAEEVALAELAAEALQQVELLGRLDPFGHQLESELAGELDDAAHDRPIGALVADAAHEVAVELQPLDRQRAQSSERRPTGAEVVDADAHAE